MEDYEKELLALQNEALRGDIELLEAKCRMMALDLDRRTEERNSAIARGLVMAKEMADLRLAIQGGHTSVDVESPESIRSQATTIVPDRRDK